MNRNAGYVLPGQGGLVYYPNGGLRGLRAGSTVFSSGAAARGEKLDYQSDFNDLLAPVANGYRGFGSLGGFSGEDAGPGGGSCGCGVQSDLQSAMQTHPFLALAGAFFLGYLL